MQPDDAIAQSLGHDIWLMPGSAPGPAVLMLNGRAYTRFLDHAYIPCATSELTESQIIVLNRYRESVLSFDPQFEHRSQVRQLALKFINAVSTGNLFEIGCGAYPLISNLTPCRYLAFEIDHFASAKLRAGGVDCQTDIEKLAAQLPSFDLIVGLFVMQFPISQELMDLMISATKADAVFFFNVATKDSVIRHLVPSRLIERGIWLSTLPVPSLRNDAVFVGAKSVGLSRAIRGYEAVQGQ